MANRNDPFFSRLTKLFRSGPAIQRRVKGYDYKSYYDNQLVRGNLGYRGPFPFGRESSPFSVLGAYGILDRMARYCLSGDVLVATNTQQGFISMKDLAAEFEKPVTERKKHYTFSYEPNSNSIVLREILDAFKTKKDRLVEVHYDNGAVLRCTADHRIMLRDGTYREARYLQPGDAVMPFYRKTLKKYKNNNDYRVVYSPAEGWKGEHKIVGEYIRGTKILPEEMLHVHHKNFIGIDNEIDNLMILPAAEHLAYHSKLGTRHSIEKSKHWAQILNTKESCAMAKMKNGKYRKRKAEKAIRYPKCIQNGFLNPNADSEFTIEDIKKNWESGITLADLCTKCGVHQGKLLSRLQWAGYEGYSDFVRKCFNSKYLVNCPKPRFPSELPDIQSIYSFYRKGMTQTQIAKHFGFKTGYSILSALRKNGYNTWYDFTTTYQNNKVVRVVETDQIEDVYDLTVEGTHNFAVIDPKTMQPCGIVHNSEFAEMEYQPEIAAALNIFADETAAGDEKGKAFHLYSKNPEVKKALEELFYDILNIDFNLRPWTRNLVKYGDFFLYNEVIPDIGIVNVQPIPVNELEREEGFDQHDPYAVRYKWLTRGNRYLENWQVSHMRVLGNDLFLPYGTCHEKTTKILTEDGLKEIQHIKVGDRVVSFDLLSQQKVVSPVLGVKNSGYKPCFEIRTKHNFLRTSKEHQILVWDVSKNSFDYKSAGDLKVGDILAVNTTHSAKETTVSIDRSRPNEKNKNGYWNSSRHIPENVTPEFARLFGFLLGDGWISRNQVCFANGVDDRQNMFYADLLEKFTGKKPNASINKGTQTVASSKMLAVILQRMGFQGKATTKRIPSWVYKSSNECRKAFLQGMHDADGSSYIDKCKCVRHCFELSNYELIKDIKALAQMLGYKTGKISKRNPRNKQGGIFENGTLREFKQTSPSYMFYWFESQNKQIKKWSPSLKKNECYITEPIVSIESVGSHETYDIYVQDSNHNFYANGIVTHNSILEPARRIWRQLIMMEDSMLVYRVVRSPERRVFYIDVGNVAPNDVPSYMEAVKQTMRSRDVVDRTNGRMDQRYNPLPVHKDTPIPLLDGRTVTIEELSKEYASGKENWVYSIQDKTQQIVPGKVIWCGKNYTAKKLVKVWLDDDTYITTAPEHPFVLRDGTSKRADQLTVGQTLMPFYRDENSLGYERCYNPATQKYETTHSLVAKNIFSEKWTKTERPTVHHKKPWEGKSNKKNNHPLNLEIMNFWEHRKWHRDFIQHTLLREDVLKENSKRISEYNKSFEHSLNVSRTNRKYNKGKKLAQAYNGTELHKQHNELRRKSQKESWKKDSSNRKAAMRWNIPELFWTELAKAVKENPTFGREKIHKLLMQNELIVHALKENQNTERSIEKFSFAAWEGELLRKGFAKLAGYRIHVLDKHNVGYKNHKIKNIEVLEVPGEDVYCMTVVGPEGEDDRHNFAAQTVYNNNKVSHNGVFVLNSIDEDYFIPVRGGQTGTKIETLAGGQNATAVDDVKYLQQKLFAAIQVPKPYLNFDENLSAKASLAQQDVRFSRTVSVLQRVIISELNKMAMVHLYSKGFDGEDLIAFELKLSNPSTVAMQQKLEALSTKFEIAGKAKETKLVDQDWIQKKILDLTDDDIIRIEAGIRRDKIREVEIEAIAVKENLPEKDTTTGPFDPSNYVMSGGAVKKNPPLDEPIGGNANTPIQPKNITADMQAIATSGVSVAGQPSASPDAAPSGMPIKATPFLSAARHNKRRRVGMGGRSNLAIPDFKDMLSGTNKYLSDINDKETLNLKSQFTTISEDINLELDYKAPPVISRDMKNLMTKLDIYFEKNGGRKNKKLLTENDVNLNNLYEEQIFEMQSIGDEIVVNSYDQPEKQNVLKEQEEDKNDDLDLSILE